MSSKVKMVFLVTAILFYMLGSVGHAQVELTLEGLSERVDTLFAKLDERISAIETDPPHAIIMVRSIDGSCQIARTDKLQNETMTKYLKSFPNANLPKPVISEVRIMSDTTTMVHWRNGWGRGRVNEYWDGCKFLGSDEWEDSY